jgi:hypothetical protein
MARLMYTARIESAHPLVITPKIFAPFCVVSLPKFYCMPRVVRTRCAIVPHLFAVCASVWHRRVVR